MSVSRRWQRNPFLFLLLFVGILLALFAIRALRYPTTEMTNDEVWFIWQSFGTPREIIQWTPYNWGPLFTFILAGWRLLTGIHPNVVRLSTALLFLPACAAIFRVARRLWSEPAAWVALVVYGTVGYGIYLTTLLYGYALLIALMPFALWFTVRYFDHPSLKRALLLTAVLTVMLYTHPTAVIAVAMLGLFTLPMYGFQVWRWLLPGGLAGILALPEFFSKIQVTVGLATSYTAGMEHGTVVMAPFLAIVDGFVRDYAGMGSILWMPLYLLASFGLILGLYRRRYQRQTLSLVLWLLALLPLYYVNQLLTIYDPPKQMWWLTTGIALWIAAGLTQFPRVIGIVWIAAVLAFSFSPLPSYFYNSDRVPFIDNFAFLSQHYRDGDVILIDPLCKCGPYEDWDYFTQAYFPRGLNVVQSPEGYRRVWYVTRDGKEDPAMKAAVRKDRAAGVFVGPWNFLFRLYEAPPDVTGVLFANGFRFHGMEIEDSAVQQLSVRRVGQTVRIKLWWSVDRPNLQGYSASIGLLGPDGRLIAQADGEPLSDETDQAPGQWPINQVFTETRAFVLPLGLATGPYQLYLAVYQPDQGVRIDAPGLNSSKTLVLGNLQIKSDH